MRTIFFVLLVGLCISLIIGLRIGLSAEDTDEQTSTVTLVIRPACHLGIVDDAVSKTLVMDSTAETAFDAGYVEFEPDKPTLQVSANNAWKLSVKCSTFKAPYEKEIGDLQLKNGSPEHVTGGFSDFKSLSTADQEIAFHNKGVGLESHPCQYRILLNYEKDIPGIYEATITYTLSTSGA